MNSGSLDKVLRLASIRKVIKSDKNTLALQEPHKLKQDRYTTSSVENDGGRMFPKLNGVSPDVIIPTQRHTNGAETPTRATHSASPKPSDSETRF